MIRQIARAILPKRLADLLRMWIALHTGEITITEGNGAGLRFVVGAGNAACASGDYELPLQRTLAQSVQPGDVFYDVGANVGFFTVIAARLVGPAGHVYAFEPVPINAAFVRRNVRLNGFRHVEVSKKAVSRTSGCADLVITKCSGGAALSSATAPPDGIGRISVETVSIDDLVFQHKYKPPRVVKVDVEGAELEVLEGMVRTIREFKPTIIYELDDCDPEKLQQKQDACESLFEGLGYDVTSIEDWYPQTRWLVKHFMAVPAR